MYHYKKKHESDSFERIASLFNTDRRHVSRVFAKLEEFRQKNMSELRNQEAQNQNQDVSNQDLWNQDVSNQDVLNQDLSNQEVMNQGVKLETSIDLG